MTIFQQIIDKKIPADIVYEDEKSLAFKDVNPQAPIHILVIPKKEIPKAVDVAEEDKELIGHLFWVAKKVAQDLKLKHFRIVNNNGEEAGQAVFHFHLHLLGGRKFGWPPG